MSSRLPVYWVPPAVVGSWLVHSMRSSTLRPCTVTEFGEKHSRTLVGIGWGVYPSLDLPRSLLKLESHSSPSPRASGVGIWLWTWLQTLTKVSGGERRLCAGNEPADIVGWTAGRRSSSIFNLNQLCPLGLVSGPFQSSHPYLDFSSCFLSSLSWQYLLTELGGASGSCLWRRLQCVYLSKRMDQTPLKAVLHIRPWVRLSSPVMIWSSRVIWRKTNRANYRALIFRCLWFSDAFSSFSHAGYSGILYSGWTQFAFLSGLGKEGFRLYFEGKTL